MAAGEATELDALVDFRGRRVSRRGTSPRDRLTGDGGLTEWAAVGNGRRDPSARRRAAARPRILQRFELEALRRKTDAATVGQQALAIRRDQMRHW